MSVYQPHSMRIDSIADETADTRTLRLSFVDPALRESFTFEAGQFGEFSVFGAGECTFCIASPPTRRGFVECSFKRVGKVTSALRELEIGDTVGFRGPYGNSFPVDRMEGADLLFIAGGIGLAPVRSVILNVLDTRDRFGAIRIVYGARSVADLVYRRELDEWAARGDLELIVTVDPGGQTDGWKGQVGFVPPVVEKAGPMAGPAFAVVCGPPIMTRLTLEVLERLGVPDDRVFTTLENRMKCGIGKCGRCNVGSAYVCKDGPVFSRARLRELPADGY